jgi:hypothetical protein
MNRLFNTLRGIREKPKEIPDAVEAEEALPGFDNRMEVLTNYAERSAAYEDDLIGNLAQIMEHLNLLQQQMELALDESRDRDALEYLRIAARIRPQRDLLDHELRSFQAVAGDLIQRVDTLMEHIDEARVYARTAQLSPAATYYLDAVLTRLTRYFVLLERVTISRHRSLPDRLVAQITNVVDDRVLDLEMATYILARRRMLGSGGR